MVKLTFGSVSFLLLSFHTLQDTNYLYRKCNIKLLCLLVIHYFLYIYGKSGSNSKEVASINLHFGHNIFNLPVSIVVLASGI